MKRVLVIEDNENNLYLVRFILEKNGYEVLEARDGKTGMELAIQQKPDLVIVDIQLPDINGLEVARQLRDSGAGELPIVALTSYALTGDREKTIKAGCTGYIEKPIRPESFISDITQFL